jgi:hypothetical protein
MGRPPGDRMVWLPADAGGGVLWPEGVLLEWFFLFGASAFGKTSRGPHASRSTNPPTLRIGVSCFTSGRACAGELLCHKSGETSTRRMGLWHAPKPPCYARVAPKNLKFRLLGACFLYRFRKHGWHGSQPTTPPTTTVPQHSRFRCPPNQISAQPYKTEINAAITDLSDVLVFTDVCAPSSPAV